MLWIIHIYKVKQRNKNGTIVYWEKNGCYESVPVYGMPFQFQRKSFCPNKSGMVIEMIKNRYATIGMNNDSRIFMLVLVGVCYISI